MNRKSLRTILCGIVVAGATLPPLTPSRAAELAIQFENGRPVLTWPDAPDNAVYTLQHLADLDRPRWEPMVPWGQWPVSGHAYTDISPAEAQRFYRLAIIERGRLANVTLQDSLDVGTLSLLIFLAEANYGIDIPFTASYAVDAYRIDYETLDGLLGPTTASGALFVPSGMAVPADLLSYQHGTILLRGDAPSSPSAEERAIGLIMASHGYAVAMPDYLGLGVGSTGLHPYVHRRSSATAVIDMLRATRMAMTNVPAIHQAAPQGLSEKLFLFGYSQGAYVTLAAQWEMQERHPEEFVVTASAPSDGPYDLSGTMAEIMTSNQPYPSPYYLPYVLFGYNEIYHFFDDPAEILVDPYAGSLPQLFDGEHTEEEINAAMPSSGVPSEILQPEFLESFNQNPSPIRLLLQENDLLNWAPTAPTRLYHCRADDIVPYTNSVAAYTSFLAAGANSNMVQLIDPDSSGTHGTCLYSGVPLIIAWFESLR